MVRRLRVGITPIWLVALVLVAVFAAALTSLNSSAGPRRVAVQATPAVAASSRSVSTVGPRPTVASTTTTSTTTVPVTTPPTTVAPTTVPRTTAPTATTAPRATPSPAVRPAVVAPPTNTAQVIGGSSTDFTLLGYRWNPCHVITVASSGPDVTGVVIELAAITGLHFEMVSSNAAITLSWGSVNTATSGGEIGLTSWKAVGGWLTQATIAIGQQAVPYLATVLRHEMGHAMGLGHAHSANEVMYPTVGKGSPTDYQAGDRAGLRAVGAAAGC